MKKYAICIVALCAITAIVDAGPFGRRGRRGHGCSSDGCAVPTAVVESVATESVVWADRHQQSALAEVNATRATRGLPPFAEDSTLTEAATKAATYRAERGIEGHTANDFAFLPTGASATAAGCAAWPIGMGWGACCTYESWRSAGAAAVIGRDGRRYMHIFVRN